jgi:general secretion pathway protein K
MTKPLALRGRGGRSDGFVVVAALWLLAALATLAAVVSIYLAQSAKALTVFDTTLRSDMLSSAGLELAAYQLSTPATIRRPTRGQFRFSLGPSNVTVEYLSEAARINLNMAPKAILAGLFSTLGADAEAANLYAERVVGWRTPPRSNGPDVEDGLYAAAKAGYLPRRAPFQSADELWLVLGLPAAIVERMLPFVTVYSGMAEVNVLDAAPTVIAALPDMTPNKLEAFLGQRDSLPPDPELVLGALGGRQPGATVRGSDAYRVRIRFTLPSGRPKISEGVILVSPGEAEAFRVLAWQDDAETGSNLQRRSEDR